MNESTTNIVRYITDGAIEALKFIPAGEAKEAMQVVQGELGKADLTGPGAPEKILHNAVKAGVEIAKLTQSPVDDKLFQKFDAGLDYYEEHNHATFMALITAIFKPVKIQA